MSGPTVTDDDVRHLAAALRDRVKHLRQLDRAQAALPASEELAKMYGRRASHDAITADECERCAALVEGLVRA